MCKAHCMQNGGCRVTLHKVDKSSVPAQDPRASKKQFPAVSVPIASEPLAPSALHTSIQDLIDSQSSSAAAHCYVNVTLTSVTNISPLTNEPSVPIPQPTPSSTGAVQQPRLTYAFNYPAHLENMFGNARTQQQAILNMDDTEQQAQKTEIKQSQSTVLVVFFPEHVCLPPYHSACSPSEAPEQPRIHNLCLPRQSLTNSLYNHQPPPQGYGSFVAQQG